MSSNFLDQHHGGRNIAHNSSNVVEMARPPEAGASQSTADSTSGR